MPTQHDLYYAWPSDEGPLVERRFNRAVDRGEDLSTSEFSDFAAQALPRGFDPTLAVTSELGSLVVYGTVPNGATTLTYEVLPSGALTIVVDGQVRQTMSSWAWRGVSVVAKRL